MTLISPNAAKIATDSPNLVFNAQNPLDGEVASLLPTCCGLVSDTAKKSATSWQQVVVMEFGKHTTQQTQRTFAHTILLRTYYVETGVMDFGLYTVFIRSLL